jgi:bifunctional oligoribonuclease and PAP phosphatase NrnA
MRLKLDKNMTYIICGHRNPDVDSIGSCLGLYYWMKKQNYRVKVLIESGDLQEIDCKEFFPTKDEIEKIKNKKFSMICVDTSSLNRVYPEEIIDYAQNIVNIDHHENSKFGDINIVDESAASCTQVLFEELKKYSLPRISLDYFYAGLISDSINFTTQKTTAKSFEMASYCAKNDVNIAAITEKITKGLSMEQIQSISEAIKSMTLTEDGILFSHINPLELNGEIAVNMETLKGVPSVLSRAKDAKIIIHSFAKFSENKDVVKIYCSVRSRSNINSLPLAQHFGGGGHNNACGFHINITVDKYKNFDIIKEEIILKCREILQKEEEQ